LHVQSVIVQQFNKDRATGLNCWCELPGKVTPGNFVPAEHVSNPFSPSGAAMVNGVKFEGDFNAGATYRVIVKGDYIRDKSKKRAIDADNLPAFWALGGKTGDGIEGGTFESWFLTG
jgi:hypothetical protein